MSGSRVWSPAPGHSATHSGWSPPYASDQTGPLSCACTLSSEMWAMVMNGNSLYTMGDVGRTLILIDGLLTIYFMGMLDTKWSMCLASNIFQKLKGKIVIIPHSFTSYTVAYLETFFLLKYPSLPNNLWWWYNIEY